MTLQQLSEQIGALRRNQRHAARQIDRCLREIAGLGDPESYFYQADLGKRLDRHVLCQAEIKHTEEEIRTRKHRLDVLEGHFDSLTRQEVLF